MVRHSRSLAEIDATDLGQGGGGGATRNAIFDLKTAKTREKRANERVFPLLACVQSGLERGQMIRKVPDDDLLCSAVVGVVYPNEPGIAEATALRGKMAVQKQPSTIVVDDVSLASAADQLLGVGERVAQAQIEQAVFKRCV